MNTVCPKIDNSDKIDEFLEKQTTTSHKEK